MAHTMIGKVMTVRLTEKFRSARCDRCRHLNSSQILSISQTEAAATTTESQHAAIRVRIHNQEMTVAARAMAERKTLGQRS